MTDLARWWRTGTTPGARSLVHKMVHPDDKPATPPWMIADCGARPPQRGGLLPEVDPLGVTAPPRRCRKCRWENGGRPGLSIEATALSGELAAAMAEGERSEAVFEPGLHFGIPFDLYMRIDAASSHRLALLLRSPAHLKARLEEEPEPTDPQAIGTALHALVLEPEDFEKRYVQGPVDNRSLKAWKDFAAGLSPGVIALRPSDWYAVHAMRDHLIEHPASALALGGVTVRELTGIWRDEASGVTCKMRVDALNPSLGAWIDVKTSRDADPRAFQRSTLNYSYHLQSALYRRGLRALLPEVEWDHAIILAVETERPWAVVPFRLREDALTLGDDMLDRLLVRYRECSEKDEWPGYSSTFVDLTLPDWSWRQIENEYQEAP